MSNPVKKRGTAVIIFTMECQEEFYKIEDKFKAELVEHLPAHISRVVFDTEVCSKPESEFLSDICESMKISSELSDSPLEDYGNGLEYVVSLDSRSKSVQRIIDEYKDVVPTIVIKN